ALGRFLGDDLIARVGSKKLLWISALLGAVGMIIVVSVPVAAAVIIGFCISGLGLSVLVPIVFSSAANVEGIAPSVSIATIAGVGILGFLAGPPIVGFIAEATSLRFALALATGLAGMAALLSFFRK
ncbi:MAG: MFS transporter, partial [Saprospiraceae bacterium]|nr:MFS transporter [Saprospiraceae bacterium]